MGRSGLYKTDVKRVRELILAQGKHPSVDAVRIALGNTGSKTTIHKYLRGNFYVPLESRMKASGLLVDVPTANAEVGKWLRDVANRRVHPLTRHAPHTLYENVEKALLHPLPKYRPRIDPTWPAMRSISAQVNSLQHPLSVYQQILTEVGV